MCVHLSVLNCDIVVSEFELHLHYYGHFQTHTLGKGINNLILSSYWLNTTNTTLLQEWLWNWITRESWYALKQRNQATSVYIFLQPQRTVNFVEGKSPPEDVSWVWYVTASGCEAQFLKILGVCSTFSIPLFPGPIWPRVVVFVRVQSMGQIHQFENYLYWNTWYYTTVCKLFVLDKNTWYITVYKKVSLKELHKITNINVQCMQFPDPRA